MFPAFIVGLSAIGIYLMLRYVMPPYIDTMSIPSRADLEGVPSEYEVFETTRGLVMLVPVFACFLLFQIFPNAFNTEVMAGLILLVVGLTPPIQLRLAYKKNGETWLIGYYAWANEKHKGPFNSGRSNKHIRMLTIAMPAMCIAGISLLLYGIFSD